MNNSATPEILELPSGPHRLVAAEKGYRISSQVLDLGRGETRDVRLALEPTGQRRASFVLLGASGVTLGAGIVLGALALQAESRAQSFLDRQARGNVSSGDLADYRAAVDDRDRYRIAGTASLIVTAGLAAAALGLYELDSPDQRELSRKAHTVGGDRARMPPPAPLAQLRFGPFAEAGRIGTVVWGAF